MTQVHGAPEEDPYLWLEDVTGPAALDWVRDRNAETVGKLSGSIRFQDLRTEIRQVLDADDRIPFVKRRGGYLYNFWQDAAHPRGLWRRTTLEEYRRARPDWEVLLDVDALAGQEGESWVWQGAATLRPGGYRLALVHLSRGGADATVVREFDVRGAPLRHRRVPCTRSQDRCRLDRRRPDIRGHRLRSRIADLVGLPAGGEAVAARHRRCPPRRRSSTRASPRTWLVRAFHDLTEGFERDFVMRNDRFLPQRVVSARPRAATWSGSMCPRTPASTSSVSGCCVRTDRPGPPLGPIRPERCLPPGSRRSWPAMRELTVLFQPDAHTSLSYHAWTRNHLILNHAARCTQPAGGAHVRRRPVAARGTLAGLPDFGHTDIAATNPRTVTSTC